MFEALMADEEVCSADELEGMFVIYPEKPFETKNIDLNFSYRSDKMELLKYSEIKQILKEIGYL